MTYMLKTGYQYVDIDGLARCFFPTRTSERVSASYAHILTKTYYILPSTLCSYT